MRADGLTPVLVLAGCNADQTRALAGQLSHEHRSFALDDPASTAGHLADIDAVIHCSGPFSATRATMLEDCLLAGTHYCDITGEVYVFEHTHSGRIDATAGLQRADAILKIVLRAVASKQEYSDVMADTAGQYKEVPDAVAPWIPAVKRKKDYA